MLADERYKKITAAVTEKGSVTVTELAETFGVSIETVRRDLVLLETQGKLKRVFGGAVLRDTPTHFETFPIREQTHSAQKIAVANKLAEFVCDGDLIAVDAGTTAAAFAEVLKARFSRLTVLTYSLKVFRALQDRFDVVLTGGEFYRQEEAFYGELATEAVGRLHTNKCFIFPSAVGIECGVEDYVSCLVPVQKAMMAHADRIIVAADSSKFTSRAFIKLCDLSPEHIYVTDADVPREVVDAFAAHNFNLVVGE